MKIRKTQLSDFDAILRVINAAAQAYKGVIPMDRWHEPYMSATELRTEIEDGVEFFACYERETLVAVMGIQKVRDVTLIRHAYVIPNLQRKGVGGILLNHLLFMAETSEVLVGTWKAAWWAIRFYQKHGFKLLTDSEKDRLLHAYWRIPERQVETSTVLRLSR